MARIRRLRYWLEDRLSGYDGILLDIDGTLVRGDAGVVGANELLTWLESISFPYLLVTNDANHSHEEKAHVLGRLGIEVSPTSILSAGDVIARVAQERGFRGRLFFVMGDLGRYAEEAGIVVTRVLSEIGGCSGVIVGEGDYDWQSTFNAVVNFFVNHPDAPFIVPNPDIYWPDGHRGIAIAAGGKARFIASVLEEYGIALQPEHLGKPYRAVFDYARSRLGMIQGRSCDLPERIILVGDSLTGDIRGANRAGFMSALVLTGITAEKQLEGIAPESEGWPDFLIESL